MNDLELITRIKNIKIGKICKEKNIDYSNLVYNRTTKEKEKQVATEIRKKLYPIIIDDLIEYSSKIKLEEYYEETDSL